MTKVADLQKALKEAAAGGGPKGKGSTLTTLLPQYADRGMQTMKEKKTRRKV